MQALSQTRVLILGGSSEATALARALAARPGIAATLWLAGRTAAPLAQPIPTRIGGFGGIDGLVRTLEDQRIEMLVDATHPFAARMPRHAREAAARAGCALIKVSRPAWAPQPGDLWHDVDTMAEAAAAIGRAPRRVFLTIGSQQLDAFSAAPQHHYLVRTIDPVTNVCALPDVNRIEARGPFDLAGEERLMRDHRVDVLVSKNSGGTATVAKLSAARTLGVTVIMVRRPHADVSSLTVEAAVAAIEVHRAATARGV